MSNQKIYNEICEQALDSLLKAIGAAKMQSACQVDVDPSVLLKLLNISLEQRELLIKGAQRFVKVDIDMEALDEQLTCICHHNNSDNIENEFLTLGAPLAMMRELFGMHASEFSLRRSVLGLGGKNRGRPRNNEDAETLIWDLWYELSDLDLRDRYLKTVELSGENLLTVWTAVKRYEQYGIKANPVMQGHCRSIA